MRTKILDLLSIKPDGRQYEASGWVRTRRDSKSGFSFLEINDGSDQRNLQVIVEKDLDNYTSEILKLCTGSSVTIQGQWVESQGKGQSGELKAASVLVHGMADEDYPLQKKRHSFEFLREIAHLRPRSNTFGAVTRVRSGLSHAIHTFFQNKNFQYVHTPLITTSDCEGAGEMFRVTTLNPGSDQDPSEDFFGLPSYLTVSGQLEGEAYACALGDIYTFGPTFRAENSNTPRHLAEFWMVEPEMAFCDLNQDIQTAEEFIKYLLSYVLEKHEHEMNFFNQWVEPGVIRTLTDVIKKKFRVLSYTEAVSILKNSGKIFEYPVSWGNNLQAEHERYLTEEKMKCPVVLIDFPASIKPFYMYVNDDQRTVRGMDVLLPRIGEIIGGSQREHRPEILGARMKEQGLDENRYSWFMDLRRFGTVPHSGFGLGLERLILFVTGMKNIRDVIPFPRTPGHAEF